MNAETLEQTSRRLEHWETDKWATPAVLKKEILTRLVYDPCCGTGIMSSAAIRAGYSVFATDMHAWGYGTMNGIADFLEVEKFTQAGNDDFTVLMNPPFDKSEAFVEKAIELGARKIVCFNRFSWYEGSFDKGKKRGQWWEKNRPARIWLCGDRAHCWRHDIPQEQRAGSTTPTAHAFFVWERGHAPAAITGHIYKGDVT